MSSRSGYGRYRGSSRSPWLQESYIARGSGWEDHDVRAYIAFGIITIFALLAILIWSCIAHKRVSPGRTISLCLMTANFLAIISFTWVTVTAVLIESSVSVLRLYYIFGVLITSLRYMADILLLAAVVASIGSYMANSIVNGPGPTSEPRVTNFVSILSIFWLVLLALQLAVIVQRIEDGGGNTRDISSAERRVNFIYDIIYTFLAFVICCGTFLLSISPRGRSSQNAQVSNALFLIIGLSLFARHMWITVTDGLYTLGGENRYERTPSTQVLFARQMFYYVCTVIAYAALVAVGSRLGPSGENMTEENIPRPAAPEPSSKRDSIKDRPEDLVYNGADLMVHV